jgi:hypothetical protein
VAGFCKHGIEPADSVEDMKFLDQLSDYQLFKKGSG